MTATTVSYERDDSIGTITLDDGKVNAMSLDMQAQIHAALDRAEADAVVVVLAGRPVGFADRVVDPDDVTATATDVAESMTSLDPIAHAATKLRARADLLQAIRGGIAADRAALVT
jgi:enoyl-CoA hydratase